MNKFAGFALLLVVIIVGAVKTPCFAVLIRSDHGVAEFPKDVLACKIRMGEIRESSDVSPDGPNCVATCAVLANMQGVVDDAIQVQFRRHANGLWDPFLSQLRSGQTYLVVLRGKAAPYRIVHAMPGVSQIVEPVFGTSASDRLFAELTAMCESDSVALKRAGVEQIGLLRDMRGGDKATAAAKADDNALAKAGLIAQYRLKIAPDIDAVMQHFDPEMLDVWYQESGDPQTDAQGRLIHGGVPKILQRGLADFDYANFVRRGSQLPWIRKDDGTLYTFFGIAWKVQRRQCIPAFVELLDDANIKIRYWAVVCLRHTVDNKDDLRWEQYKAQDTAQVSYWKSWWKGDGQEFMKRETPAR